MKSLSKISFVLILATSILLNSCCEKGSGNVIRIPRSAGEFDKIKLMGSFNLYLRQDSIQKIELVADDNIAPHIKTDVYNNTLTIKREKCFRKETVSDIFISVPSLSALTLDGSGRIQGENTFHNSNMTVIIKGSGDLSLSYEGNNLYATIDGSGNMALTGSSELANYVINGSGNINATNVQAKNVGSAIDGSGNIDLMAISSLNANISGSGNISYYGTPVVNQKISGSGSVNKK